MSKKSSKKPMPTSQMAKPAALQGIMPVIWVPASLQEALAIKQNNKECETALLRALEKLVMAQCCLRLTTDESHTYFPVKGEKVHVIRTGRGGSNLRLAYAVKDETIHVLTVFTKQTDSDLSKAEKQRIDSQWEKI